MPNVCVCFSDTSYSIVVFLLCRNHAISRVCVTRKVIPSHNSHATSVPYTKLK